MKIFYLLALLAVFALTKTTPVSAQPKVKDNTEVGKSIEFNTQSHDYGEVEAGNYPGFRFVFVNNSNRSIKVDGFSRACNVTVPSYSQEPIKPGESGYIIVVLNPRDLNGNIKKHFKVLFRYTGEKEEVITSKNIIVEGNIISGRI